MEWRVRDGGWWWNSICVCRTVNTTLMTVGGRLSTLLLGGYEGQEEVDVGDGDSRTGDGEKGEDRMKVVMVEMETGKNRAGWKW